jgi:hypothetical protein
MWDGLQKTALAASIRTMVCSPLWVVSVIASDPLYTGSSQAVIGGLRFPMNGVGAMAREGMVLFDEVAQISYHIKLIL